MEKLIAIMDNFDRTCRKSFWKNFQTTALFEFRSPSPQDRFAFSLETLALAVGTWMPLEHEYGYTLYYLYYFMMFVQLTIQTFFILWYHCGFMESWPLRWCILWSPADLLFASKVAAKDYQLCECRRQHVLRNPSKEKTKPSHQQWNAVEHKRIETCF